MDPATPQRGNYAAIAGATLILVIFQVCTSGAFGQSLHVGVQPLQGAASSFLSTGAAKPHAQATKPPIQVAAKLPTPPPMPKSIYATTKAASVKKPPPSKAPVKTPTKTPAPVLKKNPPIPVGKLTAAPPAKPPAKLPAKPPARPPQVPPPKSPVKPVVKPPPAPLRLTPIAAVQQPPWPYSSMKNIPPDVPPPPYPPAPPALRVPNVGVMTNIMDVCRVCSALPYDGACYSDYVSTCVAAMNQLRRNVWKVPDQVCDCYSAIASQMIRICPGIDRRVAYVRNCDSYCFYGARCTFVPTLYALLTPQHVVTTGNSTAAPSGRGVAVLDLQPNMTAMAGVNFLIQLSSAPATSSSASSTSSSTAPTAPLQITGASVYNSIMGSEGPQTLPLLAAQANQTMGSDGTGRVDTALGLLQRMTLEPYNFYIQVDTPAGSLRGQLVFSPHLFSLATSRNVPTSCASGDCTAIVDLDISPTNIVYSFAYSSGVAGIIGASVIQGVAGSSGARLFDFFWPGANAPSFTNGVTPPVTAIQSLLTAPQAHYIYFTTQLMPFGALRGQFQDTMYVTAVMYGASVVNFPGTTTQGQGSGAAGMGFFDAVLGGGGICYTFRFSSSVKTDCNYAYLHQGELNKRGPIYLYQTLRIIPGQQLCVPADPDITAAMALRPQRFYVQAYSLQFPYGAFRGQLHPDKQSSGLAVT